MARSGYAMIRTVGRRQGKHYSSSSSWFVPAMPLITSRRSLAHGRSVGRGRHDDERKKKAIIIKSYFFVITITYTRRDRFPLKCTPPEWSVPLLQDPHPLAFLYVLRPQYHRILRASSIAPERGTAPWMGAGGTNANQGRVCRPTDVCCVAAA